MTRYRVKNLHSTAQGYTNSQGQRLRFAPGEEKKLKSKPPRDDGLWQVEIIESKTDDIESKGGEN